MAWRERSEGHAEVDEGELGSDVSGLDQSDCDGLDYWITGTFLFWFVHQ